MSKVRFDKLTEKDKKYIKTVHADKDLGWDYRMSILMRKFGVSERTVRKWIEKLGYSSYKEIDNEEIRQGKLKKYDSKKKFYIFTWAQNNTPPHKEFWDNLLAYSKYLDANVGVVQGKYQNTKDPYWDKELHPYMDSGRHNIHTYVDVLSDVKVLATAVNPLSGFESFSDDRTVILGHPRIHLRSLPVLNGHPKKLLLTTGACTIKNYSDTKVGKRSEFHHTYGFVIVEIKDNLTYYIRQVTANDDGTFIDLNNKVSNKKVTKIKTCKAFVMGDIHCANVYTPVVEKTLKLFGRIKPKHIVLHDVFDGESVNRHEKDDPIVKFHMYKQGKNLVKKELNGLKNFIDKYDLIKYKPVVVRSNHDVWLENWIKKGDWKTDPANALDYMELALVLLNGKAPQGLVPYVLKSHYGDGITTLGVDDSFRVSGWELAQHGHLGAHGSKGNLNQYRKLNTKVIIGDYHQPARRDGAVGVGTYSKLRMGYNKGASAWMHSGAMLHNDGKVQHILFMEDNNFTTLL